MRAGLRASLAGPSTPASAASLVLRREPGVFVVVHVAGDHRVELRGQSRIEGEQARVVGAGTGEIAQLHEEHTGTIYLPSTRRACATSGRVLSAVAV
jgi:hypothetical protein